MNNQTISKVVEELRRQLEGQTWGRLFQLSRNSIAIDFRTSDRRYLYISVEPPRPRLYLIARSPRELEKASLPPSSFALGIRKTLAGAILTQISKDGADRIVRFRFRMRDEIGREFQPTLIAQMTGRSTNLFLLDDEGRITLALRPAHGKGQEVGEIYSPPAKALDENEGAEKAELKNKDAESFERGNFNSLSEALDDYYLRVEQERDFDTQANAHDSRLRQAIEKRRKLLINLEQDVVRHGDAEAHKRAGDLLLANLTTAVREQASVRLFDYFADDSPIIEIEVDENRTLQEEAAHRFALYAKARRAAGEIARRIAEINEELATLEARRSHLAKIIAERDYASLIAFDKQTAKGRIGERQSAETTKARKKIDESVAGARRFQSTDGHEILVGRSSRANDQLTFRVARSYDLWLHAADYPGSHVIVRNPKKGEPVPHRTLIEAAQLAAHFSQARKDAKVAVHYTERKNVSKIKGGAPGLVRLTSFRTIMVEPRADLERI